MVDIYATCPDPLRNKAEKSRQSIVDVARWTEDVGCRGLLIYTGNYAADPWSVAQIVAEHTSELVPLVAAQPSYMHPYAVAKMVSSIAYMYGRQLDLNLVIGGSRHQLRAVGSNLEHDERYDRLVEYGRIVSGLLSGGEEPMNFTGSYYELQKARVYPPLSTPLLPRVFVSGSSDACQAAAYQLGAVRLSYPRALTEYIDIDELKGTGIRLGIIARDTDEEAWRVARARFPQDQAAEKNHASYRTESQWFHRMQAEGHTSLESVTPYWLYPFHSFKEFCPYIVGSYSTVGHYIAGYLSLGVSTLILSTPQEKDDLYHARTALEYAGV